MSPTLPKVLAMVALPVVAFAGGAWLMGVASDRAHVVEQLERNAEPRDRTPLNRRLRYDEEDVRRHWDGLDPRALAAERRFLLLDLGFPLLYGGALLTSMLIGARLAKRPRIPAVLLAAVVITMLSDWAENLIHLTQLQRYTRGGGDALSPGWISAASVATLLKLLFFTGASFTIVSLAVGASWRSRPR